MTALQPTAPVTLVVSEVFGPTIQGEGPSTGQRAAFVRLGRCNLYCSWCDTPYTWDWTGRNGTVYDPAKELTTTLVADIVHTLDVMDVPLVVITGGEPMIQRDGVTKLAAMLRTRQPMRIELETNGTRSPWSEIVNMEQVHYNVSPKLSNSGVEESDRYKPKALADLLATHRAIFKFVVAEESDLAEVDAMVMANRIPPSLVWLMPEGRTASTLASRTFLAEAAIERGYNLSGRLHVQLWGDTRGH